jgi:hypothetical protein
MKIRLVVALVGLAISFALPAIAQDKNTVDAEVPSPTRQSNLPISSAFRMLSLMARTSRSIVFLTGEGRSAYRILVHRPDFLKSFENFPWELACCFVGRLARTVSFHFLAQLRNLGMLEE